MTGNLFVDVHILQDVPPSNLNRDDNGSPKKAIYGGVDRLRASSQAWKRATRLRFREDMPEESLGVRTRRLTAMLVDGLAARGIDQERATELAAGVVAQLGIKAGKKEAELSYLLFFGRRQLAEIIDAVVAAEEAGRLTGTTLASALEEAVDVRAVLGTGHPLDVALFGRMVADLPGLNVDAATQVAHAISTHAVQTQFDYFTAVDDQQQDEEPGAGMIGTVEFSSATLYRYATIAVPQLLKNLGAKSDAVDGVARFLRAFALSVPAGHQNTFAAHTRPGVVAVVVREDQPVNLVSAFEKPVEGRRGGTLVPAMRALAEHAETEARRWGDDPVAIAASYRADEAEPQAALEKAFGPSLTFDDLIATVAGVVERRLAEQPDE